MFFQSFDGRIYTFPATCQYVLVKSRLSGKFTVTLQNAPCGPVSIFFLSFLLTLWSWVTAPGRLSAVKIVSGARRSINPRGVEVISANAGWSNVGENWQRTEETPTPPASSLPAVFELTGTCGVGSGGARYKMSHSSEQRPETSNSQLSRITLSGPSDRAADSFVVGGAEKRLCRKIWGEWWEEETGREGAKTFWPWSSPTYERSDSWSRPSHGEMIRAGARKRFDDFPLSDFYFEITFQVHQMKYFHVL